MSSVIRCALTQMYTNTQILNITSVGQFFPRDNRKTKVHGRNEIIPPPTWPTRCGFARQSRAECPKRNNIRIFEVMFNQCFLFLLGMRWITRHPWYCNNDKPLSRWSCFPEYQSTKYDHIRAHSSIVLIFDHTKSFPIGRRESVVFERYVFG